ncbi:MAG TPA: FAD-dependent monooxygenase [Cyclobacteriaceae bacterium]
MKRKFQVAIIGGGLGGLICANYLAREKIEVCLIERKSYPFHRVCGEYVSNEVKPFLQSLELFPTHFNPPEINRFILTSINGKKAETDLRLGGFGISRFSFDHLLSEKAKVNGAVILTNRFVDDIAFDSGTFKVSISGGKGIESDLVIGAFGKRSSLDKKLSRPFLKHKSPYIGVKYHIHYELPKNEIQLHNFEGGYCGISNVENNTVNLCYLSERGNLKKCGNIQSMEEKVLQKNPFLKEIWRNAEFVMNNPIVINEINFESKNQVESHILMVGDSAGMIAPLCGNGMSMAIHAAKIACEEIVRFFGSPEITMTRLETNYMERWKNQFSSRMVIGRNLQKLFGSVWLSNASVGLLNNFGTLGKFLINKTHGQPF